MQRFAVRVSSADPLYIGTLPGEPNSRQRERHILFRDFPRTRINIGALARVPEPRVAPPFQAIVRLRSSLPNASSSVHGNEVTPVPSGWSPPYCRLEGSGPGRCPARQATMADGHGPMSNSAATTKWKQFLETRPPNSPLEIPGLVGTTSVAGLSVAVIKCPVIQLHCKRDGGSRRFESDGDIRPNSFRRGLYRIVTKMPKTA